MKNPFRKDRSTEKKTKTELRDEREQKALNIQTWSAVVSTLTAGASIAALCLNRKGGEEAGTVWLNSESAGLIRWRLRAQTHPGPRLT